MRMSQLIYRGGCRIFVVLGSVVKYYGTTLFFILTGVIFIQTVGLGQVTFFKRIIAFVRVAVELQLCGNVYF